MKEKTLTRSLLLMLVVMTVLLAADQYTKFLTDEILVPLGSSRTFLPGIMNFTSVHNTGAAFGMMSNMKWVLIAIRVVASAGIIYVLLHERKKLHLFFEIPMLMILSGAVGNLIDQFLFGYVRDMLEVTFVRFAVFNVADVYITVGVAFLAIDLLFLKQGRELLSDFLQDSPGKTEKEENGKQE